MKDYYSARAKEYDRIYLKPERQTDLQQLQMWLPPLFAGRSVLEIACGTGYWTQFYASGAESVVALDASSETLAIAAPRVTAANVHWLQADVYALPLPDSAFDAVFAGFWWSHIPVESIEPFLSGLHRVLKPGAKVVFLDNRFVSGSSTPIAEQDSMGNTYQMRSLDNGSTSRVLKNFPTREQLQSVLAPHSAVYRYYEWTHFWAVEYSLPA